MRLWQWLNAVQQGQRGYLMPWSPVFFGLGVALYFALPVEPDQRPVFPDFYVKPPFDGQAAAAGNGSMTAFEAASQQQVRDLHAAALAAGGSDEGQPGFRASYGPQFYVGYLRDPQGNKIALFSSNPDEPGRDG